MITVSTRDLKQNPAAAIRQVLDADRAVTVTAHGKPTGVVMTPVGRTQRSWVSGGALANGITRLGDAQAQAWDEHTRRKQNEDFGRDLWQDAA